MNSQLSPNNASDLEVSKHQNADTENPASPPQDRDAGSATPPPADSFDDMNLKMPLLRGIYAMGFERPSEVQKHAVPALLTGRDVLAQAQSGTGKTGTFTIGLLQCVDAAERRTQAVVLAPTRELAEQSFRVCDAMGAYMDVVAHVCVGGRSMRADREALRRGAHVVVGTPGRLLHLARDGLLQLRDLKMVVVDEADEMLTVGFQEQLQEFVSMVPECAQVALFSATMPRQALELTQRFLRDPVTILLQAGKLTLEGITQYAVMVDRDEYKLPCLLELYESIDVTQAIVFVNRRERADWLADKLNERDFTVTVMHGDMEQAQRDATLNAFRSSAARVLIATDILGRGVDVQGVSLVINFDMPLNRENYIHRIGRTGRFGRKGVAISLLTQQDAFAMDDIMRFYQTEVRELPSDLSTVDAS